MVTSLETHCGLFFDLANPRAEDVRLGDIAVALSNTCRFGGHVKRYYSVAEHACVVYTMVKDAGAPPELCLAALHHDSHEAYIGDVPTPLKRMLGEDYQDIAHGIDVAIAEAFRFDGSLMCSPLVKDADTRALRIEARYLKASRGTGPHWGYDSEITEPRTCLCLTPERAAGWFERCHVAAAVEAGVA